MNDLRTFPIFYFSGTGNTWWVCEQIASKLREKGFAATAYSIEQVTPQETAQLIAAASLVGFGFPIYGSDAPRIFHDFIKKLPVLEEPKGTLGFVTQMLWSGDGFNFLRRRFHEKNFHLRWTAEFLMPNNIALPIFPLAYSAVYSEFEKILEKSAMKADYLSEKIAKNTPCHQHTDIFSAALAWIQRGPFRLAHDWGRKYWSIDEQACTACERCARICPVDNIQMKDGLPKHGNACVYCMRCFNYCPTTAIRYMGMNNKKAREKPPFKGPVPEFKPELISKVDA